jgi:hypothetical protein
VPEPTNGWILLVASLTLATGHVRGKRRQLSD